MQEIDPAAVQQAAGIGAGALIFMLAFAVLMIASMWKVFTKAGKPGWAAIVPIYNIVVLLEIIRKPMWWIAMFFIPFVSLIFAILMYVELAKAFGKGGGFAAGLILLSPIFFPILGFGGAQYVYGQAGTQAVAQTA
jgi:hypothetical protein